MRDLNKRNSGMTLIELLVTLMVLAIVAAFAIPSFQQMIANNRIAGEVNAVSGMIAMARSEASTKPGAFVNLCSSSDGSSCSGSVAWEDGWIMFRDFDSDGSVDSGDTILRVGEALDGANTIRVNGFSSSSSIQFDGEGMPRAPASNAAAGTLTVCDDRGVGEARSLVVAVSGQTRRVENGVNHAGNAVSCP